MKTERQAVLNNRLLGTVHCPLKLFCMDKVFCLKCASDQVTAEKKGFSAAKAAGGAILTGGIGLLAGFHGSSDIEVHCLACGHKWNPKKLKEEQQRARDQKAIQEPNNWQQSFYDS